jgi:hypothetical protein
LVAKVVIPFSLYTQQDAEPTYKIIELNRGAGYYSGKKEKVV